MLEGDAALAAAAACPCMIVMSAEKHTHLFVGQVGQDKKTWCHFALHHFASVNLAFVALHQIIISVPQ
jgi:hypothetical protein